MEAAGQLPGTAGGETGSAAGAGQVHGAELAVGLVREGVTQELQPNSGQDLIREANAAQLHSPSTQPATELVLPDGLPGLVQDAAVGQLPGSHAAAGSTREGGKGG